MCGTIKCPNFSQENDIDDDVDLSSTKIDKDEPHDNDVLKFAKSKGHRAIRAAMKVFLWHRNSTISHFLERILMEHIVILVSLDSKLQISFICSIKGVHHGLKDS